ncbi:MAG: sulfotransferase domain-containing protein [Rivularia sp. (in: cyanobacteria)]|mgnify:CR=1 FL=1
MLPIDVFIISFPKCGRTWLKFMIGRTIVHQFGLYNHNYLNLDRLAALHPLVPRIVATHDDDPHWKKSDELFTSKTVYQDVKVIFLARDPRDVLVSTYFEQKKRAHIWIDKLIQKPHLQAYSKRIKPYSGNLSSYLKEEVGSIDTIIKFYNIWAENRTIPKDFLLLRYEDLQQNTHKELRRVMNFVGIKEVSSEIIAEAVKYASFDNMHKMETDEIFNSYVLKPTNKNDLESYKTRRGKVGGFTDYLNEEEIAYINSKINDALSDFYRYRTHLNL